MLMSKMLNSEFERAAEMGEPTSTLRELWGLVYSNKKWWLLPILAAMMLMGLLLLASSTAAAPFIYTLF
jgi:hypothetical protein